MEGRNITYKEIRNNDEIATYISQADMSLASYLAFWCSGDIEQMDRLFRKSGLMRDKWDRAQSGSTYGEITLNRAVTNASAFYKPINITCESTIDLTELHPENNDRYRWTDSGNGRLFADEVNFDRDWLDDARRYYTNIVGKYGPFVQALLKKAGGLDIKYICPLHGPVIRKDFGYFIDKYDKWSRYEPEEKGVLIAYASMYGNTEAAACLLASKLAEKGMTNIALHDVSNTHVSYLIADAFKYSNIVLASVTYNLGIYPVMHNFLMDMKALNLQKRTVAIIENGSWACKSGTLMRKFLDEEMKEMTILDEQVTMASSLNNGNMADMDALADRIIESMNL